MALWAFRETEDTGDTVVDQFGYDVPAVRLGVGGGPL